MEEKINETKPCLVQTAQGFTISYNQKFLYSKYAPDKAINQYIQNLKLLPQTLILCISPVLNYGLQALADSLPPDCLMLGCEYDENLYDFICSQEDQFTGKNYSLLTRDELLNLGPLLTGRNSTLKSGFTLPQPGTFRRVIRVDFSAGAQFCSQFYDMLLENTANAIMTFWANRVTLVKFGRKYSTNFFKNLIFCAKTGETVPIQKYFGAIEKQIIVFGAGESAAQGIALLQKQASEETDLHDKYFIVCADTALQPLVTQGIIPDGVFIEEAQNVITKCFIGIQKTDTHIFAGLSSVHSLTRYFKPEQLSYFTTEYTQAEFIERFEKMGALPPKNEPFGSVGITAFYYANLFRKDTSVPITTYGLDFAYSVGRTHTKGTMADNARFMNSSRIKPDANFGAAFNEPAIKRGLMYTTPILERYRQMFEVIKEKALRQVQGPQKNVLPEPVEGARKERLQNITNVLSAEQSALIELKSLLTGEKTLPPEQQQQEITRLITEREYLYLHFPDGHRFVYTQSFLNRVRVEVDYYLKVLS